MRLLRTPPLPCLRLCLTARLDPGAQPVGVVVLDHELAVGDVGDSASVRLVRYFRDLAT